MEGKSIVLIGLFLAAAIFLSGCVQPPICGNGTCELSENASSCPQDCGIDVCGDGICGPTETAQNCPQDCGYQSAGILEVKVTDINPTTPGIAGAEVKAQSGNYSKTVITDAAGVALFATKYGTTIYPYLNPGVYTITTTKKGYKVDTTETEVNPGETTKIVVRLVPDVVELECTSDLATYGEGTTLIGLQGAGAYAGQSMKVKIAAVTQTATAYMARFELYDRQGNLVDSRITTAGVNLNEQFLDANGALALNTVVRVSSIRIDPETSKGLVEIACTQPPVITNYDEIQVGNNAIAYKDGNGVKRSIPFMVKLATAPQTSASQQTIDIDTVPFYAECYKPATGSFVIFNAKAGDPVNGFVLSFNGSKLSTDNGWVDLNKLVLYSPLYIGGTQFDFAGMPRYDTVSLRADANCAFASEEFPSAGGLSNDPLRVDGVVPLNKTVYLDDTDLNRGPSRPVEFAKVGVMAGAYKYRVYYSSTTIPAVYLLLDAPQEFVTDKGKKVSFSGTDTSENGIQNFVYYWPDKVDFGNDPADSQVKIAQVEIQENSSAPQVPLIDVMVNTATNQTLQMPEPQLFHYLGCVYYDIPLKQKWLDCSIGGKNSVTTGYGSELSVVPGGVATIKVAIK